MAKLEEGEFVYYPTNEWISLPDLVVLKSEIVAVTFGDKELFTMIALRNGLEVKTEVTDRTILKNLVYSMGDKVNGKTVIRKEGGEDNG